MIMEGEVLMPAYSGRRHYDAVQTIIAHVKAAVQSGKKTPEQALDQLGDCLLLAAEALDQNMGRGELQHRLTQHPIHVITP
jgi:hypothetical protein